MSEDWHVLQSYRSAYPVPHTAASLYPVPPAVLFDPDDILHDPWCQDAAAVYSEALCPHPLPVSDEDHQQIMPEYPIPENRIGRNGFLPP